jgi:hypothetical protein
MSNLAAVLINAGYSIIACEKTKSVIAKQSNRLSDSVGTPILWT